MTSYPLIQLGEIASPERGSIAIGPFGSRMKADTYTKEGVPVVRGTNISTGKSLVGDWVFVPQELANAMANCVAKPGDLVLPHRGSIGEVAFIGAEFPQIVLSSSMMKFRPDPAVADGEFIYYFLKSEAGRNEILRFGSQVGTPGIGQPLTSLRQVRVPLPPLIVQQNIARTLSALDDKIELNRRMNETLEAMAQAIFRDWFVDFGPTRRKLAGLTDAVEIMGGLVQQPARAAELAALFPNAIGDNGLPEGWEVEALLSQADWVNGAAYKNMHFSDAPDALPVIKIAELKAGVTGTTMRTNSQLGERYRIKDGELLFSWSGNPDTSIDTFVWTGGDAWLNQHIFAVRENGKRSATYLHTLLRYLRPQFAELARNKQTTGLGHVTKENMSRLLVTRPTPELSIWFDHIVDPIHQRFRSTLFENQTLTATRDLLLPKLMSGEIRLRDAERIAEAAQ